MTISAPPRIDPAYIQEQREQGWPDIHPEDYCHLCGVWNPGWHYDGDWSKLVQRYQEETGREGILCPVCAIWIGQGAETTGGFWKVLWVTWEEWRKK